MNEWLPIETAPKDGTRVLLWIMPTRIAMPFEWKDDRWMGDDYPLNMAWPTHWMPMPPPPASADTRPKGGDGTKIAAPSVTSGAVPEGQTPNPSPSPAAGR